MAYFAELDENNMVIRVISISNDIVADPAPNDKAGRQFLQSIGLDGTWIQTSYNGRIRGKYAAIGDSYDPALDEFVSPVIDVDWPVTDLGRPTS